MTRARKNAKQIQDIKARREAKNKSRGMHRAGTSLKRQISAAKAEAERNQ